MIYLTEGNIPLNAAYDDNIVQEANSTYQLTFKFPTNDILWQRLREEKFLTADDLHGEQDFVIFEVEKKHGYIQIYANQVFTLLNNYVVNPISLDRQTGSTALSRFAGSITRDNPFSFFSDIDDRHTFNTDNKNAMDAFSKDKHSILGLWGGDLVRHGYQVRLLKNGGSENESLFMYKKNLSSYEHKTSTKSLRTRITFITTIRGEGEKPVDKHYKVVVDSPLINKYSQIYEDVVEVNDQDVVDEATLLKYGKQYFRTTLCDMLEDSIEIDVIGQSDVPVQMFDVVSAYHEQFDLDVRKKITKYNYSPMAKKLKSIGFGDFKSGLANAIGNAVSDAVKNETQHLQGQFASQLAKEIKNADLAFDRKKEELVNQFTDGLNAAKAKAEEVKQSLTETIDQRFNSFNNGPLQEAKRRAEEALRNAGASTLLAQEAKQISERAKADIATLRQNISNDYVAKSQHVEDVRGLTRRFEEINLGSPNLIINGAAELGDKNWGGTNGKWFTNRTHGFYKNSSAPLFTIDTKEAGLCYIQTGRYNQLKKNTDYTLSFTGFMSGNVSGFRVMVGLLSNKDNVWKKTLGVFNQRLSPKQAERFTVQFNSGDYDGFSLRFDNFGSIDGQSATVWITEIDVYEGTLKRAYQPAPENNQNYAYAKISEYRTTVDGRFANVTSQIAGKANQTDFQRVQETSKLYERILGNTDNGIADNVARMALTSQLFQVEVAKNASNGQNLLKGTKEFSGDWKNMAAGWKKHSDKYQGCDVLFKNNSWEGIGQEIDAKISEIYTFSLWMKSDWKNDTLNFYVNRNGSVEKGWGVPSKTSVAITSEWKRYSFTFKITADGFIFPRVERPNQNTNLYVAGLKLEKGSYATPYTEAPEDTDEAIRTVQNQLTGSWAVQNLTSAGAIASQINATNNQVLIEAEKIRFKGKALLDELTAIQGYFKRLFVGDANVGTLNSDIIRANSITADKLVMDMAMARRFVSSDIFTDTLAAKEAFINKLRSVVVTATLLEGYKGRIGGFQIGTHDKDPNSYWLTGQDQFAVGMGNGRGREFQTAFWANWGNTWGKPGPLSWYVTIDGKMYCNNDAAFHRVVDFSSKSVVNFYGSNSFHKNIEMVGDTEIYGTGSTPRSTGRNAVVWWNQVGDGTVKYWIDRVSDRRLKRDIVDTNVNAIDRINQLRMVAFDFIKTGKHEEIGLIAQEVEAILPSAISKNPEKEDDYLHIDYVAIVPYLVKAIQELNHKIEKLEKTA